MKFRNVILLEDAEAFRIMKKEDLYKAYLVGYKCEDGNYVHIKKNRSGDPSVYVNMEQFNEMKDQLNG